MRTKEGFQPKITLKTFSRESHIMYIAYLLSLTLLHICNICTVHQSSKTSAEEQGSDALSFVPSGNSGVCGFGPACSWCKAPVERGLHNVQGVQPQQNSMFQQINVLYCLQLDTKLLFLDVNKMKYIEQLFEGLSPTE